MKIRRTIRGSTCLVLTLLGVSATLSAIVSYYKPLELKNETGDFETGTFRCTALHIENGSSFFLQTIRLDDPTKQHKWYLGRDPSNGFVPSSWQFSVFTFSYAVYEFRGAIVPLWLIALISFPYPIVTLNRQWRKRKRRKRGKCLQCGYDLTGNVTGKCSECGTAIASNAPVNEDAISQSRYSRALKDYVAAEAKGYMFRRCGSHKPTRLYFSSRLAAYRRKSSAW